MMSCKVVKINKYNWPQERYMIITQDNVYNFKSKSKFLTIIISLIEVKRIIEIAKLAGLTKSVHKSSREFVIHVVGEHDYRFKSDQ